MTSCITALTLCCMQPSPTHSIVRMTLLIVDFSKQTVMYGSQYHRQDMSDDNTCNNYINSLLDLSVVKYFPKNVTV